MGGVMGQIAAIVLGGCAGALLCRMAPAATTGHFPPILMAEHADTGVGRAEDLLDHSWAIAKPAH